MKILSLYGILEKYIKAVIAMYENKTVAVKMIISLAAGFVLNQECNRVVFYNPLYESF